MKIELEFKLDGVGDVVRLAALAGTGVALFQELSKPPAMRTWHGIVADVVPYDFRPPTMERARDSYWNPDNPSIFTPALFGVGWALNIPALASDIGRFTRDALREAGNSFRSWRMERSAKVRQS